jgi:O-antigen ligase
MKILLIYFLFFTFYIDQVLGPMGFSYIMRGFSLYNLNIYILLFVWVAEIIKRRNFFIPNNLNFYIILMAFIVLISVFVKIIRGEIPNLSLMHELLNFKGWLNPVLLFFIFFNIVDNEKTCDQILLGLSFLFIALIIAQLSATFGITSYKADIMAKHGRAGGFGAAGEYAITLALFFPLVISESFLIKRKVLFKIFCVLLGFLMLVGLIHAGSRNGVVSILCGVLAYILILNRKKLMSAFTIFSLILALIMVCATAFFISPLDIKFRVSERFNPSKYENISSYTSGRIELWKNGWRLFIESPLIGHGQNSFRELTYLRGYRASGAPHNEYIKYLTEQGIIGLVFFLLLIYKIFKNIWRALEKTKNTRLMQLYISYIAGIFAFSIGMFATNAGPSLFIFWIYTATIYKYVQLDMEKTAQLDNYNLDS